MLFIRFSEGNSSKGLTTFVAKLSNRDLAFPSGEKLWLLLAGLAIELRVKVLTERPS